MSLVPFTFKNVELKVVTINGKPWTRAKEVCKALEYNKKTAHVSRENYAQQYDLSKWSAADPLTRENYAYKYDLSKVPTAGTSLEWPPDSRKLHS